MKSFTLEELILLGIQEVIRKRKKCSYGDLIKELFSKHPNLFSITDYPKWPDTLKLDRPLRSLRSDRLVNGSPTTFYSLTPLGMEKLRSLKDSRPILIEKSKKPTRSPSMTILNELENSQDFQDFVSNRDEFQPNNMRIRALTRFTLETPKRNVLNHLFFLEKIAHKEKKKNLEDFLGSYINYMKGVD